jgi:glutaconyl-CoA decarboxylase
MKKFKVTVNGQSYEVAVEEVGEPQVAPVVKPQPAAAAVPDAPKKEAAAPETAAEPVVKGPIPEGAIIVKAPMPGKISALKAEAGKAVKRGDIILVLEAMKMQNDITATADGTLHEIRVAAGDNVKTGEALAVITK